MNPLSTAHVNAVAPYEVKFSGKDGVYQFDTEYGVHYFVEFMEDDLLLSQSVYQLSVANPNNKKSPRDLRLRETIIAIVVEFFRCNNVALLYICETGDNRQQMRNRLFEHWFSAYRGNASFLMVSTVLFDEDGTENFAAIILRKDNPRLKEIVTEFTETAALLGRKPE